MTKYLDYRVRVGQNIINLAMQFYGSIDGLQLLVDDNADRLPGIHFASFVPSGTVLRRRVGAIDGLPNDVREEYLQRGIRVATGQPDPQGLCAWNLCDGTFRLSCNHPDDPEGIDFWEIENDFIVS